MFLHVAQMPRSRSKQELEITMRRAAFGRWVVRRGRCAFAATATLTSGAAGQWTVTSLNPQGATYAEANGAGDGQQVGRVAFGGVGRARWVRR